MEGLLFLSLEALAVFKQTSYMSSFKRFTLQIAPLELENRSVFLPYDQILGQEQGWVQWLGPSFVLCFSSPVSAKVGGGKTFGKLSNVLNSMHLFTLQPSTPHLC